MKRKSYRRLQLHEKGKAKTELLKMCIDRQLSPQLSSVISGIPIKNFRYYLLKYYGTTCMVRKRKKIKKPEILKQIEALHKEGKNVKQIAFILNCHITSVYNMLKRLRNGGYLD